MKSALPLHLVLDIGNSQVTGAFYKDDEITHLFRIDQGGQLLPDLERNLAIQTSPISTAFITSVNHLASIKVERLLQLANIPILHLRRDSLSIDLNVESVEAVGADLIANTYGALSRYPGNSIVVDLGTALTVQAVGADRSFLGTVISPGPMIAARALSDHTDALPIVNFAKPKNCLGRATIPSIQSGLYYGILGTIEKLVSRIQSEVFADSPAVVIATGGITETLSNGARGGSPTAQALSEDLSSVVDYFDPELTVSGVYEIFKEQYAQHLNQFLEPSVL